MTNFFSNPYVVINGGILITWILFCILKTIGYYNDRNKDIYLPKFESDLVDKAGGSVVRYYINIMFNHVVLKTISILTIAMNLLISVP